MIPCLHTLAQGGHYAAPGCEGGGGRSEAMTPEYLAKPLTPYSLPTKDGWILRTIDGARSCMLALPKNRERRAH
jgi:hypothetical protein